MKTKRRDFLKYSLGAAASLSLMNNAMAEDDAPNPKSNRFILYIHFGSACGIASGLVQPLAPGKWPLGFFQSGAATQSNNPLLNSHTAAGSLVFHDYLKFLEPMAKNMCLVNGTPQSLDHSVARVLQKRGVTQSALAPEWAMGVAQFMKTEKRKNPIIITKGTKTQSVADITMIAADSLNEFKSFTSDGSIIPKNNAAPVWEALKNRFAAASLSSTRLDPSLGTSASYQLSTLIKGLPELSNVGAETTSLTAALDRSKVNLISSVAADNVAIASEFDDKFRDKLILAGILAKTGLANGMNIDALDEDNHGGGAEVLTARRASSRWATIFKFWQWIQSQNLQNDVLIVVGQEFSRTPYNIESQKMDIVGLDGKKISVVAPGRDHGLSMGTMFIGENVPNAARFGIVTNNMVPQATRDAKGTVDTALDPFVSTDIVGSMMMRVFDDLFPSERQVRKHWPTFKTIPSLIS